MVVRVADCGLIKLWSPSFRKVSGEESYGGLRANRRKDTCDIVNRHP